MCVLSCLFAFYAFAELHMQKHRCNLKQYGGGYYELTDVLLFRSFEEKAEIVFYAFVFSEREGDFRLGCRFFLLPELIICNAEKVVKRRAPGIGFGDVRKFALGNFKTRARRI